MLTDKKNTNLALLGCSFVLHLMLGLGLYQSIRHYEPCQSTTAASASNQPEQVEQHHYTPQALPQSSAITAAVTHHEQPSLPAAKPDATPSFTLSSYTPSIDAQVFFDRAQNILAAFTPAEDEKPQKTASKKLSIEQEKDFCYHNKINQQLLNSRRMTLRKNGHLLTRIDDDLKSPGMHLRIAKDGTINALTLVSSSGSKIYDDLALKAVRNAAPFPKIPAHLNLEYFIMNLTLL